ncbi:ubiquinone biosynthesis monooxygenase Coq7 [Natronospira proteinivora]|uniref:3-demethoxyubiquinol 3-hydroxylase n=1 Tax=Natronospira proteinivora TaxID=1807133 RepID=A0ABT1G891_9GAMM|nr:2-polyprenyl-3-methyl-6-methoxy-1,4-benzoquinone monooxygenase [Natronospira proteinivora]MCP1727541.1 ubiquinone biosynthesis monooxygenase Coq7 [Natronospira proteinivora]
MTQRQLTPLDQWISGMDRGLRTLFSGQTRSARPSPADDHPDNDLSDEEQRHVAGLMRVNHAGEVAAQALYQSQALTARNPAVTERMQEAADEEIDHLAWCAARLEELGDGPSHLTPFWYAGAFTIGTVAGTFGDRWNLGFVAETEAQVCHHLEDHLGRLPAHDQRSRAVLTQMQQEEEEHRQNALEEGGSELPAPVKGMMWAVSRVMTTLAYRI